MTIVLWILLAWLAASALTAPVALGLCWSARVGDDAQRRRQGLDR